jgi:hypothetical protein
MAHLWKKERWLNHAGAMIEDKSLAKTAGLRAPSVYRLAPGRQAPNAERDGRGGRDLHSNREIGQTQQRIEQIDFAILERRTLHEFFNDSALL